MNKGELIEEMAKKSCLSKKDTISALDSFIDIVSNSLKSGEEIKLTGFGKFEAVRKSAATRRNPLTGEMINTPEKLVPKFRASSSLKNLMNQ